MADASGFQAIYFTIDGTDVIDRKLATFGHSIGELAPVWEEIGGDLRADFMQNMIAEGRLFTKQDMVYQPRTGRFVRAANPKARDWVPLAASTVRQRIKEGYGGAHPILFRRGDLAISLAEKGAAGNISEVSKTGARFGSNQFTARWHQEGTVNMPDRPIVGLTRSRQEAIVRKLGDFVREQAKQAGLNAKK